MTRQEIKDKTVKSPIVFHDDEKLECYMMGLQDGVDVAERELIDNACNLFKEYHNHTYQMPQQYATCLTPHEKTTFKTQTIDAMVYRFRMTLTKM